MMDIHRVIHSMVGAIPGEVVLDSRRKLDEQATGSNPVSNVSPQLLLQFLPLGSGFEFLP